MILEGKICPYCLSKPEFTDSKEIYGKSYGMVYLCRPCDAYVGVHRGTNKALGRLANKELREAKKEAHFWFDKIAKTDLINDIWENDLQIKNRSKAYKWLSMQMRLPEHLCHIGMMDIDQCNEVMRISKKYLKKLS